MITYYEVDASYRQIPSIRKVTIKKEIKDYRQLDDGMMSCLEIDGGFCPHNGVTEDCFHEGFRNLQFAKEYALKKLEELYEKEKTRIQGLTDE